MSVKVFTTFSCLNTNSFLISRDTQLHFTVFGPIQMLFAYVWVCEREHILRYLYTNVLDTNVCVRISSRHWIVYNYNLVIDNTICIHIVWLKRKRWKIERKDKRTNEKEYFESKKKKIAPKSTNEWMNNQA